MNSKWISAGVVVAAIVAVGAWVYFSRPANSADFPDGTFWICSDPKCKHEFVLTMTQLSNHHAKNYGQPVPCSKCGKEAIRADRCKHCGKFYIMQRDPVPCPFCKKMQPAPTS